MLSREQCQRADRVAIEQFRIPGLVLMENAGRNCAEKLLSCHDSDEQKDQAVVILCGPGNNGGDGFVIARHLYNAGLTVKVVLFHPPESYSGDALSNVRALSGLQIPLVQYDPKWTTEQVEAEFSTVQTVATTWVVDALLGTGARGEPRDPMNRAIDVANSILSRKLAVDIPSGLDCDTGVPSRSTFIADVTCTFIDQKTGFENESAAACLGELVVVGIGAPPEILDQI